MTSWVLTSFEKSFARDDDTMASNASVFSCTNIYYLSLVVQIFVCSMKEIDWYWRIGFNTDMWIFFKPNIFLVLWVGVAVDSYRARACVCVCACVCACVYEGKVDITCWIGQRKQTENKNVREVVKWWPTCEWSRSRFRERESKVRAMKRRKREEGRENDKD